MLGILVQLANCIYVMKLFDSEKSETGTDKVSDRMLLVGSSNPTFITENATNTSLSYIPIETRRSSSSTNSLDARELAINSSASRN